MSFLIICNKCGSNKITVTSDTYFKVHIECNECGQYAVEDEDLIINDDSNRNEV